MLLGVLLLHPVFGGAARRSLLPDLLLSHPVLGGAVVAFHKGLDPVVAVHKV